jgi:lipoprotein-anchoring transpeptidase ErfK/SrfK
MPSVARAPTQNVIQRQMSAEAEIEELTAQVAPDPDLEVQDGSAPVMGLEPVGELSDAEPEPDATFIAERAVEPGGMILARAPAGGTKQPAKKASPKPKAKPKPPWIPSIHVDLASQTMTLTWSDGRTADKATVSTGKGCPNTADDPCPTGGERYCTPTGDFNVGFKGDADTVNSHKDKMSWFVQVVQGIGIHDSQKADGTPRSHGCVRVGDTPAADALAKRINTNVNRHTTVHIEGKAPTKPWHMAKKFMETYRGCPDPPSTKKTSAPAKKHVPSKKK